MNDSKKQLLLRLSNKLYNEVAEWAEADFRSINGQIEYLLSLCVKQRKKNSFQMEHIEQSKKEET